MIISIEVVKHLTNPISLPDKHSQQTRNRMELPWPNKETYN